MKEPKLPCLSCFADMNYCFYEKCERLKAYDRQRGEKEYGMKMCSICTCTECGSVFNFIGKSSEPRICKACKK